MKKKLKLKKAPKIIITVLLIMFSVAVYSKVGQFGQLAQTHTGYQLICIGSWFWLLTGQFIVLSRLWGE